MKKTHALVSVACALLDDPDGQHWGYELAKKTGVRSGVLYPMLSRLLDAKWLVDGWEDPTVIHGRPPRRYYQLTKVGSSRLQAVVAEAAREPRFAPLFTLRLLGWEL
jgi:PadR family transcriptional regulator PadR